MGTLSRKIVAKLALLLSNTIILSLIFYLTMSSEKINDFFDRNNITNIPYYIIISIIYILGYFFNNKIIKIIEKNIVFYLCGYVLVIVLSIAILYAFSLLVFPFLFIYTLSIILIAAPYLKHIIIANVFTFIIVVLLEVFNDFVYKISDSFEILILLAFSYFGIFHFISALLNRKILSELERKNK
ncbi:hypothetical protein MUU74_04200 [Chryseobacterium daecheongense]|uniref:hypothetical protein n=1 Tax=Chryseobacterium daecheongense TaxID=192389 RepID=UPI001FD6476E|nr:hypothetical protein [Chryseobacterium daecheongense]UOU99162.1 hypothetical protein MUU74_04200 [Chryseobacterium daecheongense]